MKGSLSLKLKIKHSRHFEAEITAQYCVSFTFLLVRLNAVYHDTNVFKHKIFKLQHIPEYDQVGGFSGI